MSVFSNPSFVDHEEILFCHDPESGLKAIIAVHDTTLGPALGGCRFWDYGSEEEALSDVLRLSRGMTYKAAITGLNLGGGKAVIMGDAKKLKSEALFRAFGRFVDSLSGRYITAEDVNITVKDMEYVHGETDYVTGIPGGSGDPSPITALGVFEGLKAAVKYKMGKDNLNGVKVAVQGIGHVGRYLCQYLHDEGAKLWVSDIDAGRVKDAEQSFGATPVNGKDLYSLDVDVYAPCALGATINDETVSQFKAKIIAGAANNQLAEENRHGMQIRERDILYAPDYVINAGGLINVYQELQGYDEAIAKQKTRRIYDTAMAIFKMADEENIPTHLASNRIAEARVQGVAKIKDLRNSYNNQSWSR